MSGEPSHIAERDRFMACVHARRSRMIVPNDAEWLESPWQYLKRPAPSIFGLLVEEAIMEWLGASKRTSTEHDICIGGMDIEVKGATSFKDGWVRYSQIRVGHQYSHVILIAFLPTDVRGWLLTKDEAIDVAERQNGQEDSILYIRFHTSNPPAPARPRDGNLHELRRLLPASETLPY